MCKARTWYGQIRSAALISSKIHSQKRVDAEVCCASVDGDGAEDHLAKEARKSMTSERSGRRAKGEGVSDMPGHNSGLCCMECVRRVEE